MNRLAPISFEPIPVKMTPSIVEYMFKDRTSPRDAAQKTFWISLIGSRAKAVAWGPVLHALDAALDAYEAAEERSR